MPVNDALGTRMKEYYEAIPKMRLMRRTPVAIRLDGRAFHTFTRSFQKPFDAILVKAMQNTMKYLCEEIQGCVFGYTQSDEITLILIDYQTLETDAWFDWEVQKICSVAASMATLAFNTYFKREVNNFYEQILDDVIEDWIGVPKEVEYYIALEKAVGRGATFDCRCFNIPKEEVCNLILWRQLDATRNSIQMVGQANFSHKELQNKSCNMIQDMLHEERGINWNDFPTYLKRGSACVRSVSPDGLEFGEWIVDLDMPILKGEDRNYVEQYIYVGE